VTCNVLVCGASLTTSQADSSRLKTCGPGVDQPLMQTAIQTGSEVVGQLPPEP
jgi:hypothetical protein